MKKDFLPNLPMQTVAKVKQLARRKASYTPTFISPNEGGVNWMKLFFWVIMFIVLLLLTFIILDNS
jgi:hypothetical protein